MTEHGDFTPAHRNLLSLQRAVALKQLDAQMDEDWKAGYGPDVDEALERRYEIMEQERRGQT